MTPANRLPRQSRPSALKASYAAVTAKIVVVAILLELIQFVFVVGPPAAALLIVQSMLHLQGVTP